MANKKNKPLKTRGSWFGVNPCTKVIPDKKKESKKKACRKGEW